MAAERLRERASVEDLAEASGRDAACREILVRAVTQVAQGLAGSITLLNPDHVVLGGGVSLLLCRRAIGAAFERSLTASVPRFSRTHLAVLKAYDEGRFVDHLSYPVQAVRLDPADAIVALGGEPVVDYALRTAREMPGVVVAGYSNAVQGYVPSRRVLDEGGYEAGASAVYYRLPGPFTRDVEDRIFEAIGDALRAAGPGRTAR